MNTLAEIEARLSKMEGQLQVTQRHARRYRRLSLGLGAGLVGVLGMAAALPQQVPAVVQAQRLEIVGPDGKLLLAAGAGEVGGQLDLWDAQGRNVLRMSTNESGGDLAMWNLSGVNVFGAYATPAGSEVTLWNTQGSRVMRAHTHPMGATVNLQMDDEHPALALSADTSGGSMSIFNAVAGRIVSAGATTESTGRITVADDAGQVRGLLAAGGTGGDLRLLNSLGSVVYAAGADGNACGMFTLGTDTGSAGLAATTTRDFGGALALLNGSAKRTMLLGSRPQGGLLNIMNAAGGPVVIAGYAESGSGGAVSVKNSRGVQVFIASSDADDAGQIRLSDGDGRKPRTIGPMP